MNIIIALGHPAHYHLFKNISHLLKLNGNNVLFVITPKDVLEKLLIANEEQFVILANRKNKENLFSKMQKIINSTRALCKVAKQNNANLLVGCMSQIAYAGRIMNIPSIFVGEDDFSLTWVQGILTYPFINCIIAPVPTNTGPFIRKRISYQGYNELAYLHPNHFTPQKEIVEKYFSTDNSYFILRFAQLKAYHDIGIKGINTQIAQSLINILKPFGNIYITSERELEPQFEQYRIKINANDMHHVMAFASIYIGDSQTMAAEAGVLGIPFIRFNDFVGKLGYLKELEDVYKLGYGIKPNNIPKLYTTLEELLRMKYRDKIFKERRNVMLSEKIDCNKFFVWFIENYPQSKKIMKENPDYQYNFK